MCRALLVAVLAVRALGQTDLNPVSGVGKLSQVSCLSNMAAITLPMQLALGSRTAPAALSAWLQA